MNKKSDVIFSNTSSIWASISCHNKVTIFWAEDGFKIWWVINRWMALMHKSVICWHLVSHPIKNGCNTTLQCSLRGVSGGFFGPLSLRLHRVLIFKIAASAASLIGPNRFRVSWESWRKSPYDDFKIQKILKIYKFYLNKFYNGSFGVKSCAADRAVLVWWFLQNDWIWIYLGFYFLKFYCSNVPGRSGKHGRARLSVSIKCETTLTFWLSRISFSIKILFITKKDQIYLLWINS